MAIAHINRIYSDTSSKGKYVSLLFVQNLLQPPLTQLTSRKTIFEAFSPLFQLVDETFWPP